MQCPRCRHENPPRAKFCEECATSLAQTCASCGNPIAPTAKFCPECAHPATVPAGTQLRHASPESYTPKHLAERILTSKRALEGERKQVTVLFADLKGSMELLADRDPEEARKILDPVALGDYPRAMELLRGVLAREIELMGGRSTDLAPVTRAAFRSWLAWGLAETGEFQEGLAVSEEGVRLAHDEPFALINALFGAGFVHLLRGDFEPAIVRLEHALGLCRFWQIPIPLVLVVSQLGYAYALSGRLVEALPLLEEGVKLSDERWGGSQRMAWLAEAHSLAGRLDEAGALARDALELARAYKERGHETWVLRLLGEIAAQHDPLDPAATEDRYQQALGLATELGMRPLTAHCHLGLGKLYRGMGRHDLAREHLTTATTMYREMAMGFWLTQAEGLFASMG